MSGRAHLLLPTTRCSTAPARTARTEKIGTTGRGIGPAYEDKVGAPGIRVADLRDPASAPEAGRAGGVDRAHRSCGSGETSTRMRWSARLLGVRAACSA